MSIYFRHSHADDSFASSRRNAKDSAQKRDENLIKSDFSYLHLGGFYVRNFLFLGETTKTEINVVALNVSRLDSVGISDGLTRIT